MSDLAHADAETFSAASHIRRVTIHAMPANAQVPASHYLIVLWHVPEAKGPPYTPSR
jgi:hypothetical protein